MTAGREHVISTMSSPRTPVASTDAQSPWSSLAALIRPSSASSPSGTSGHGGMMHCPSRTVARDGSLPAGRKTRGSRPSVFAASRKPRTWLKKCAERGRRSNSRMKRRAFAGAATTGGLASISLSDMAGSNLAPPT